jgi:hypothetical protein
LHKFLNHVLDRVAYVRITVIPPSPFDDGEDSAVFFEFLSHTIYAAVAAVILTVAGSDTVGSESASDH